MQGFEHPAINELNKVTIYVVGTEVGNSLLGAKDDGAFGVDVGSDGRVCEERGGEDISSCRQLGTRIN